MSKNIPESLRRAVAIRAQFRCEYCRRPEGDSFIRYQTDHIISRKHGGKTSLENLAHTCFICNGNKGTDIATILENEVLLVQLFNPRKHDLFEHFDIADGQILPKTEIGSATVKLLKFNEVDRILEQLDLIEAGVFS